MCADGLVYNVEVDGSDFDSKNYLANGIVVHNCHTVAARTRSVILMRSRARWRIGMSGTALMRCDMKNALVIGLLGPVIFTIDIKELSAHKAIARGTVRNVLI